MAAWVGFRGFGAGRGVGIEPLLIRFQDATGECRCARSFEECLMEISAAPNTDTWSPCWLSRLLMQKPSLLLLLEANQKSAALMRNCINIYMTAELAIHGIELHVNESSSCLQEIRHVWVVSASYPKSF